MQPQIFRTLRIESSERARDFLLKKFPQDTLLGVSLETDLRLDAEDFHRSEGELHSCSSTDSVLQIWHLNERVLAIVFAVAEEGSSALRIRLLSISQMLRIDTMEKSILRSFLRLSSEKGFKRVIFPLYPDTSVYLANFQDELAESGWTSEVDPLREEAILSLASAF